MCVKLLLETVPQQTSPLKCTLHHLVFLSQISHRGERRALGEDQLPAITSNHAV